MSAPQATPLESRVQCNLNSVDCLDNAPSLNLRHRTQRKHKVVFVTIVPSPYQRDLFGALAAREDIDLSVYYLEVGRAGLALAGKGA